MVVTRSGWSELPTSLLCSIFAYAVDALTDDPLVDPWSFAQTDTARVALVARSWSHAVTQTRATRVRLSLAQMTPHMQLASLAQRGSLVRFLAIESDALEFAVANAAAVFAAVPNLEFLSFKDIAPTPAKLIVLLDAASIHCRKLKTLELCRSWSALADGAISTFEDALTRWKGDCNEGLRLISPPFSGGDAWMEMLDDDEETPEPVDPEVLTSFWIAVAWNCPRLVEVRDDEELTSIAEPDHVWKQLFINCRELRELVWWHGLLNEDCVAAFTQYKRHELRKLLIDVTDNLTVQVFQSIISTAPQLESLSLVPHYDELAFAETTLATAIDTLVDVAPARLSALSLTARPLTSELVCKLSRLRTLNQVTLQTMVDPMVDDEQLGACHINGDDIFRLLLQTKDVWLSHNTLVSEMGPWFSMLYRLLDLIVETHPLPVRSMALTYSWDVWEDDEMPSEFYDDVARILPKLAKKAERRHPGMRVKIDLDWGVKLFVQYRQITWC